MTDWQRTGLRWIGGISLAWLLWLAGTTFLASHNTQMQRAHEAFVQHLSDRDWNEVDAYFSTDYSDMWGQNAEAAKKTARLLLQHFIFISIQNEIKHVRAASGIGYVKTRLTLEGTGAGVSSFVVSEAKRIKEPWVFHWKKTGRWPWSWQIVSVANPALEGYRVPKNLDLDMP